MDELNIHFLNIFSYTRQADHILTLEIASNALKSQDRGEHSTYHKDVAQIIKQELDSQKG